MLKVGLTGGIGSGKSVVAKIFQVIGIPLFDADAVAKKIMQNDPIIRDKIKAIFGESAYKEGQLNRTLMASKVFNDADLLAQLNAIVHPATILAADHWMMKQTAPYTIKEAALLFESSGAASLDFIIGVSAPLPLRLLRVMRRDGMQPEEVKARMQKQMDDSIKMKLCDAVILNDDQLPLIPQVLTLHDKLLSISAEK